MSDLTPSRPPGEALEAVGAKLVWVCAGCDECAKPPSERTTGPCNGPSHDGAWMVPVEDLDRAVTALRKARVAVVRGCEQAIDRKDFPLAADWRDVRRFIDNGLDNALASSPGENEGERS